MGDLGAAEQRNAINLSVHLSRFAAGWCRNCGARMKTNSVASRRHAAP